MSGMKPIFTSSFSGLSEPAAHTPWPATWTAAELTQRSAARVAKEPVFAKVLASTRLLLARRGETLVPLQRAAFEARRKAQRAELEAIVPDLDKAPPRLTVTLLEPPPAPAKPGDRVDDRLARWQDQLARDPWLAEAARVVADTAR